MCEYLGVPLTARASDVSVLRSADDGASWCILNMLEAFQLGDRKLMIE